MRTNWILMCMIFTIGAMTLPRVAPCETEIASFADEETATVKPPEQIRMYPAKEPRPALKYELLPPFVERRPGNAAVYYGKVTAEQTRVFGDQELLEKVYAWLEVPLEELRRDEVREQAKGMQTIFYQLRKAACSESCDWQLPIRDEMFFEILLPEVQQTRQFARLLQLRARLQIADGQFAEAIETLQVGYALARHVGQGRTLVNGLVGIAISQIMSGTVRELVQQPDAPNLYWALTMLPDPLVDVRGGVEVEMSALELTFPDLMNFERSGRGELYWGDTLFDFWSKMSSLNGDSSWLSRRETLTVFCLKGYPQARRALQDRGLTSEQIDAMPVGQVIAMHTIGTYRELRDDLFKWFYVSYPQASAGIKSAERQLQACRQEGREVLPVASLLLPAIGAVRTAMVRHQREFAVLRTIEAIRLHAADHQDQLPTRLQDIAIVPVPVDPVTERPFQYTMTNDRVVLSGPTLQGQELNLELRVAR